MFRLRVVSAFTVLLAAVAVPSLHADVKSDEKGLVRFEGTLGRVVNLFGGRSAREGVTTSVAVKGNRKATGTGGNLTQIVDLDEEKVYDIDARRKEYRVTTFAELRRQMEEARRKAEEDARKAEAEAAGRQDEPAQEPDPDAKELDVDFDVKETGQKKTINGFDTRQFIVTVTLREKDKTLEQSGGLVLTTDTWLTSALPQLKEIAEFDMKYAEKLQGPMMIGASPESMAAALAMYPGLQDAIARMRTETANMDGTPIQTTMTVEAVKSAEQIAEEQKAQAEQSKPSASGGIGGLVGGLARRARGQQEAPKARATFMTTTHEVLKVATSVTDADVAIPAGFKEAR